MATDPLFEGVAAPHGGRAEAEAAPLLPKATHSGVLTLGPDGATQIDCFVLEDGSRVLTTRGVMKALGRRWRGRKHSGTELPVFVEAKSLNAFIDSDLRPVLSGVFFRTSSGRRAEGLSAEVLPRVCEVYLKARDAGALAPQQVLVAKKAEILMRALAHVGITALIDEATGYQRDRARDALAKILEEFVAKEIQRWVRTFPLEFYELICKLKGWSLKRATSRGQFFGRMTNNLVYHRLAPGVLKELEEKNPLNERGRRSRCHHQHLTRDVGHPKLKEHIAGVVTAMRFALVQGMSWSQFLEVLDKTHPKYKPLELWEAAGVSPA